MENLNNPLVSICCLCYNHEPYIRECLEGFMMQKANFGFEVLIHDDASSDKSADIIREYEAKYPEIIKPIYQFENQHSKGVGVTRVFQFPRAQGKYIAMCEGDDYWTDPYKLQKQVDFLEANEEYSLSFHKTKVLSGIGMENTLFSHLEEKEYYSEEIYSKWTIPTCSILFKNNIKLNWSKNIVFGDVFLFLSIIEHGRAFCHGFEAACYRINSGSISIKQDLNLYIKLLKQYLYFLKRFPKYNSITKDYINLYLDSIFSCNYFKKRWRYRLIKIYFNPRLIFSKFIFIALVDFLKVFRKL